MTTLPHSEIEKWANDVNGPVALHLEQKMLPVEGKGAPIFPPTYADVGYNIDKLDDGTKVVTIDSVGSQANRMEPIFLRTEYAQLVPQIDIVYKIVEGDEKKISILEAGHRLGDAIVRGTPLKNEVEAAFRAAIDSNDVGKLASLAPTSLVFGVWDSRESNAKFPRIVNAVIRAWDVSKLSRAAQYQPPIDYVAEGLLDEPKDKSEADQRSARGYLHAPAIWRDSATKERIEGGVIARGDIRRDVTVNLVALRRLHGKKDDEALHRYILGLSLVAATAPLDPFLRQGCLLVPDVEAPAQWTRIDRNGARVAIVLTPEAALAFAERAAKEFGVAPARTVSCDKALVKDDAKRA